MSGSACSAVTLRAPRAARQEARGASRTARDDPVAYVRSDACDLGVIGIGARIPTPGPYRDTSCYLSPVSMDPWGDDVPIVHVDNFSYGLLNPVLGGG